MAFLTACGIGANDVANAFATSVGAGTLSLLQAVIIAAFCEFLGAFLLGGRVAAGIQKVIVHDLFAGEPEVLMVGFLVADFTTGLWLLMATRCSMPVSATHSVIGALIGFLIAAKGSDAVNWLQVLLVIISWLSAPICAGLVTAVVYCLMRRFILLTENSYHRTIRFIPLLLIVTFWVNLFFMMYFGMSFFAPIIAETIPPGWGLIMSFGVAALVAGLWECLVMPCVIRSTNSQYRALQEAKRLRAASRRLQEESVGLEDTACSANASEQPTANSNFQAEVMCGGEEPGTGTGFELLNTDIALDDILNKSSITVDVHESAAHKVDGDASQSFCSPAIKRLLSMKREDRMEDSAAHTITMAPVPDAHSEVELYVRRMPTNQLDVVQQAMQSKRTRALHQRGIRYNEKTELLFQFLLVVGACFDSLAHGANEVTSVMAPFSSTFAIYMTNGKETSNPVPWWILVGGGAGIVVGLAVFGTRIIQAIGVRLVRITPSRGFCIELCTAITTITCSLTRLPVSTTHCQVGSTVALGLVDGKQDGVDWRLLGTVLLGWFITLPVTGLISGLLFSVVVYSPTARLQ